MKCSNKQRKKYVSKIILAKATIKVVFTREVDARDDRLLMKKRAFYLDKEKIRRLRDEALRWYALDKMHHRLKKYSKHIHKKKDRML